MLTTINQASAITPVISIQDFVTCSHVNPISLASFSDPSLGSLCVLDLVSFCELKVSPSLNPERPSFSELNNLSRPWFQLSSCQINCFFCFFLRFSVFTNHTYVVAWLLLVFVFCLGGSICSSWMVAFISLSSNQVTFQKLQIYLKYTIIFFLNLYLIFCKIKTLLILKVTIL